VVEAVVEVIEFFQEHGFSTEEVAGGFEEVGEEGENASPERRGCCKREERITVTKPEVNQEEGEEKVGNLGEESCPSRARAFGKPSSDVPMGNGV